MDCVISEIQKDETQKLDAADYDTEIMYVPTSNGTLITMNKLTQSAAAKDESEIGNLFLSNQLQLMLKPEAKSG